MTVVLRKPTDALVGFDASITSNLPLGGGLSSSASLEVALLRALRELFALGLDASAIARLASAPRPNSSGRRSASWIRWRRASERRRRRCSSTRDRCETNSVPLPAATELIVIDSGIPHGHAGGEYRTRRRGVRARGPSGWAWRAQGRHAAAARGLRPSRSPAEAGAACHHGESARSRCHRGPSSRTVPLNSAP